MLSSAQRHGGVGAAGRSPAVQPMDRVGIKHESDTNVLPYRFPRVEVQRRAR